MTTDEKSRFARHRYDEMNGEPDWRLTCGGPVAGGGRAMIYA